jgi:predicted  nucleic acid-binding Zn-ribbon protein
MTFPKLEAALTEIKSLIKGITESSVVTTVNGKVAELEAAISGELTSAHSTITALNAEKLTLTAALEKAQGEANTFGAKVKALNEKLDGAVTSMKLDCKADATEEDKFSAVCGAVNAAIEKTGVDLSKLPGTPAGGQNPKVKTLSRLEFEALPHGERSNFFKSGGKLKD